MHLSQCNGKSRFYETGAETSGVSQAVEGARRIGARKVRCPPRGVSMCCVALCEIATEQGKRAPKDTKCDLVTFQFREFQENFWVDLEFSEK